jgi:hypothetical protein
MILQSVSDKSQDFSFAVSVESFWKSENSSWEFLGVASVPTRNGEENILINISPTFKLENVSWIFFI